MADDIQKHPKDWVSSDDPVTSAQASCLKILVEQAHRPVPKPETKADASELIDKLKHKVELED
ncbi:DUF3072 domain-containing protein [Bradyrhizobium sp. SHOUNA76]|uniref:DUF3072 domain-containing protein n=1 Tax=Bradyrhizobium sp. SHOUNA76 TaxID=2908927 RepID=UPI001FF2BD1B|nr:DUF3072 domain-containing protein [Bradyrhizobium sp. SHOUNA76]MCJ9700200.1 DUF3072 domain-containing protein [Bradyrhizobium sp. SHOUNA76]